MYICPDYYISSDHSPKLINKLREMNEIKGKMGCDNDIVDHVFLVSFPGQGHVNPLLRLGKLLASKGLAVTFCTPESWGKEMRKGWDLEEEEKKVVIGKGFIRFEWFEDGWDEDEPKRLDLDVYLPQLERVGKQVLPTIISKQNPPVSCLINNPFIPWVSDVAQSLSLPSALLCFGFNHVLPSLLTIITIIN